MKNVWNFQVLRYETNAEGGVYSIKTDFPEKYEPLLMTLAPVLKSCYFRSILLRDEADKMEIFIGRNKSYKTVPFFIKLRKLD